MPSELANQAKPKPAAKPPNMAPQGRLGAAAAAAPGAGLAAVLFMFWAGAAGAAGVASRCVTLLDCLPNDLPPPKRLAASALMPDRDKTNAKPKAHSFMIAPK